MNRHIFVALGLLITAACGSSTQGKGGGSSASSVSVEDYCSNLCGRQSACDESRDVDTCTNGCMNVNAAIMPKLRGDMVSSALSCIETKDCATVLKGTADDACLSEAAASVAPTEAGQTFCSDWASSAKKCGASFNKAACLEGSKLYTDTALTQGSKCTTKACPDVVDCIRTTLGTVGFSSTNNNNPAPNPEPDPRPGPADGDDGDGPAPPGG
jgi:hypothetical protein